MTLRGIRSGSSRFTPALVQALLCFAILGLPLHLSGQTTNSYPMLMSLRPTAVQIGQTTEVELSARYSVYGSTKVFVSGAGVICEPINTAKLDKDGKKPVVSKMKLKFTVAPDATPGVRDFRILTAQGASTVGQVVLTREPIVAEAAANDVAAMAQPVTIPAALCGIIEKAEDLDFYKFRVEAGQTLVFHVYSQRLQNRIHDMQARVDPLITVRTLTGGTLAACDNTYAGDPLLVYQFAQAGEYLLEMRDVRYEGNAEWTYCIEMHSRPFITQTHPLAVVPGLDTPLLLAGANLPPNPALTVKVPADAKLGLTWIAPEFQEQPTNPIMLLATAGPIHLEAPAENNLPAQGQPFPLQSTVCGVIEQPGDIDCYTFDAKAGETWTFNVVARRANSKLDPIFRILNDKGGALVEVDDSVVLRVNQSDSRLESWAAPADGKYTLEIRDLHLRGGPEFPYAIETLRTTPNFELQVDTDKTLLSPGTSAPIYVKVLRKNGYVGEVSLAIDGLPAGVTATVGRILVTGNDGCIILKADPAAQPGGTNIQITGVGMHAMKDGAQLAVTAVASTMQEIYSPGGGRAHYNVDVHTVSVSEPMDIRGVKLSTTEIVLKPGETQKIDVEIERAPGFAGNVTLDVVYQHLEQHYGNSLPKGVTLDVVASKTLLAGTETKGYITLKAAADAPTVEKQLLPIMAHVSINFVMKMTYCGEPVYCTVLAAEPAVKK